MKLHNASLLLFTLICGVCSPSAAASIDATEDPRLNQKVTYHGSCVQLQEVAKLLTQMTGVTVVAGAADSDWKVKERKVYVHIKDLPLSSVLDGLSKTLDYHISRSGSKDKYTYRIWQDKRGKDNEVAELDTLRKKVEERLKKLRRQAFDDAVKAANMTPEEAEKLKDENPWLAEIGGKEENRPWMELMASLPSDVVEKAINGSVIDFDASQLPFDIDRIAKLEGLKPGVRSSLKAVHVSVDMESPDDDDLFSSWLSRGSVGFIFVDGEVMPGADLSNVEVCDNCGKVHMGSFQIIAADSPYGRQRARYVDRDDREPDTSDIDQSWEQIQKKLNEDKIAQIIPTPKPDVPALLTEIEPITEAEEDWLYIEQITSILSEKTDLSYIAEENPEEDDAVLPDKKVPLYTLLDYLQTANWKWEYGSKIVRLHPIHRGLLRKYDVPDSFIKKYRKILEEKGVFDLDDIGEICNLLTEDQILHTLEDHEKLDPGLPGLYDPYDIRLLKLYGQLNASQKARLKSESGLPLDSLTRTQHETLNTIIDDVLPEGVVDGRITVEFKYKAEEYEDEDLESSDSSNSKQKDQPSEPMYLGVTLKLECNIIGREEPESYEASIDIPTAVTVKAALEAEKEEAEESSTSDESESATSKTDVAFP